MELHANEQTEAATPKRARKRRRSTTMLSPGARRSMGSEAEINASGGIEGVAIELPLRTLRSEVAFKKILRNGEHNVRSN